MCPHKLRRTKGAKRQGFRDETYTPPWQPSMSSPHTAFALGVDQSCNQELKQRPTGKPAHDLLSRQFEAVHGSTIPLAWLICPSLIEGIQAFSPGCGVLSPSFASHCLLHISHVPKSRQQQRQLGDTSKRLLRGCSLERARIGHVPEETPCVGTSAAQGLWQSFSYTRGSTGLVEAPTRTTVTSDAYRCYIEFGCRHRPQSHVDSPKWPSKSCVRTKPTYPRDLPHNYNTLTSTQQR